MGFKDKFRSFLDKDKVEEKVEVLQEVSTIKEDVVNKVIMKKETTIFSKVEEIVEETKQPLSDKEVFSSLDLSGEELLELKKIAFSELVESELTISELVDLVLLQKSNKQIQEKNRDALIIREFVSHSGKITTKAKVYLEESTTKERLRSILQ